MIFVIDMTGCDFRSLSVLCHSERSEESQPIIQNHRNHSSNPSSKINRMSALFKRTDGRGNDECRPISIEPGFMPNAEGSALVKLGNTHVICTATVSTDVPRWMRGRGTGWVTAEYGMLPRSTDERIDRRRAANSGRSREIERLIGRSLRAITDMTALGECAITVDCDVLRADGGTRTASITGGYVALAQAIEHLQKQRKDDTRILTDSVAAISVGIVNGQCLLDLPYQEDSSADVDMNIVMTWLWRLRRGPRHR